MAISKRTNSGSMTQPVPLGIRRIALTLWAGQFVTEIVIAAYQVFIAINTRLLFRSSSLECETCGAMAPPLTGEQLLAATQIEYWGPMLLISLGGILYCKKRQAIRQPSAFLLAVVIVLKLVYALMLALLLGDVTLNPLIP